MEVVTAENQFQNFVVLASLDDVTSQQVSGYFLRSNFGANNQWCTITRERFQNFECTLQRIDKVRVTISPVGNVLPIVVFSKTLNPLLTDAGNILWMPKVGYFQPGIPTAGIVTAPANWYANDVSELSLNSEYKYFKIYLYDKPGAVAAAGSGGLSLPGPSTSNRGYVNGDNDDNGRPYAHIFLQFIGR